VENRIPSSAAAVRTSLRRRQRHHRCKGFYGAHERQAWLSHEAGMTWGESGRRFRAGDNGCGGLALRRGRLDVEFAIAPDAYVGVGVL
jgi:hypothetical protein